MSAQQHPSDPRPDEHRPDGPTRDRRTRMITAAITGVLAGTARSVTAWILHRLDL
ncbi:hypothetical protein [Virgisporangium aurantiacum]|uniref:Uncharacterized protein n=1 Tax=Virgisporangium aurantiacum TaxID=175570 RepID=A0A8J3Z991_9ACTN|nr:hypothetical protein [Virgisporangium aurantiacum]GIJ57275.1 hypothetical protein Vau01_047910 [Virgisporangium aurantiacum]